MLGREWLWVGLLAAAVSGCGGEDDDAASSTASGLAGFYETLREDYYQPCDGTPSSVGVQPPYFRVVDESLLNGLFVSVYRCRDSDPSSCDNEDTGSPLIFLAEETAGGVFHTDASSRSGNGADCTASWYGEDVKKSADGVTLASEERSGAWSGADCTGDFTAALVSKTKSLPCFQREVREGRLVQ
jgi:hypothetical protein